MTLPHAITLPSGAVLTVTSVEPSAAELRGFKCLLNDTGMGPLELCAQLDFRDMCIVVDKLTALANDAHEQQEADEERDKASHRCGAGIFSSPSSPS